MQEECPHGLTAAIACRGCASDIAALTASLASVTQERDEWKNTALVQLSGAQAAEASLAELRKRMVRIEEAEKDYKVNNQTWLEAREARLRCESQVAALTTSLASVTKERDELLAWKNRAESSVIRHMDQQGGW